MIQMSTMISKNKCNLIGNLHGEQPLKGNLQLQQHLKVGITSGVGTSNNYENLVNKPSINDVVLIGNKTFEELGLIALSNLEIETLLKED